MAMERQRWTISTVAAANGKAWVYQLAGDRHSTQASYNTAKQAAKAAERAWKRIKNAGLSALKDGKETP